MRIIDRLTLRNGDKSKSENRRNETISICILNHADLTLMLLGCRKIKTRFFLYHTATRRDLTESYDKNPRRSYKNS